MNIIVSTFPDPDIPAPVLALVKAHALKQKNVDQLLERSEAPDLETLARSPFLDEYRKAIAAIESNPVTKMLQGEALHHAALIKVKRAQQAAAAVTQTLDLGREDTNRAATDVLADATAG